MDFNDVISGTEIITLGIPLNSGAFDSISPIVLETLRCPGSIFNIV